MFILYLGPYFLFFTLDFPGWAKLLLAIVMGIGMAGVGMNVMHDANHGAYSSHTWINKFLGASMYILAGNVYNWQIQHNHLHHGYTNIHDHDEDMDAGRVIRFSRHAELKRYHRFQHYYAWILYGLLTINWVVNADFAQTKRYLKRGLGYKGNPPTYRRQWSTLIGTKLLYIGIWIVIPIVFFTIPWWQVLLGFCIMHYVAGFILSIIFQLAHMVGDADMPLPDETGSMKNTWAIHQLYTTVNFATNNWLITWYTGGLNRQIEHHIFPNVCHEHYPIIAKFVKKTAWWSGLPYHEYDSFWQAIVAHGSYLKQMGQKPVVTI